jgi:hypothetical protein
VPAATSFGRGLPGVCVPQSEDQCHSSSDLDLVTGGTTRLVGRTFPTPPPPDPLEIKTVSLTATRVDAGAALLVRWCRSAP